jgi:hypothetical protein
MKRLLVALVALCSTPCGCALFEGPTAKPEPACSRYVAKNFLWKAVNRVLILPLGNESPHPHAAEEIRVALAAEFQILGKFEVVMAPDDAAAPIARTLRVHGQFLEAEVLRLAREYQADGVLIGSVSQYNPYTPPYAGITLQLIIPAESVVVAEVDGFWDARNKEIAADAQAFNEVFHPFKVDLLSPNLSLLSPHLFQRYVCAQAARSLLGM